MVFTIDPAASLVYVLVLRHASGVLSSMLSALSHDHVVSAPKLFGTVVFEPGFDYKAERAKR